MNAIRKISIGASVATLALAIGLGPALSDPAGATSRSTVATTLDFIGEDVGHIIAAASPFDSSSMSSACTTLYISAGDLQGYTRPPGFSRSAWRHLQNAASYYARAGTLCSAGAAKYAPHTDYETGDFNSNIKTHLPAEMKKTGPLLQRAEDEIQLANKALR